MRKPTEIIKRFDLNPGHSLKLLSHHKTNKDGTSYETLWYDEHDTCNKLVARYRAWINRGNNPPYRRQTGWEQYSLSGDLLDREVRYAKRENMDFVH